MSADETAPLELRSDLITLPRDGALTRTDKGWAISTPSEPNHYIHNVLCFDNLPADKNVDAAIVDFRRAFPDVSTATHEAICWSIPLDAPWVEVPAAYVDAGFFALRFSVLARSAQAAPPPVSHLQREAFVVRELAADDVDAWNDVLALYAYVQFDGPMPDEVDDDLIESSVRDATVDPLRELVRRGRARMWVIVAGGEFVAAAPLVQQDSVARFQAIVTHPNWRGRGLCSQLIEHAIANCHGGRDVEVVLVTEHGSAAERLYQQLGFTTVERSLHLVRGPAMAYWEMSGRGRDPYVAG